ncbi:ASA1 [Candida pseudojiufengensis]|uniref:ASA1 n=1 Tax=Candida pseudojiufengensis TaxID=497109 RepID=UPI002225AF38|nr:ASA1 [Candida pseudojiufengensis]KAI5965363.1 ASA1 [Candida pseudojiufengensis]
MRLFGLRSHQSPITYILPINSNTIYTSDQNGFIIKWDLSIKRPILKWKAHNDSILTLINFQNKYLISHSRDSTIKIWLNDKCEFEFPSNSLNFSNILLYDDQYLITPATIDSNNLDIYRIQLDSDSEWQLTRVVTNFSCYQLSNKNEILSDEDSMKGRKDFGIIMKFYLLNSIIYIGFESGDIIGLKMILPDSKILRESNSTTIINKDLKLELVYHNSTHSPNPVISLSSTDNYLVSGSTGKKLIIHKSPIEILKFSNSGIQSILSFNNQLIIGFWNGLIEYGNEIIERNLPQLKNEELTTTPTSDVPLKTNIKLTFMSLLIVENESEEIEDDKKKKYSSMIKRRQQNNILFVGYEDGSILAYAIK